MCNGFVHAASLCIASMNILRNVTFSFFSHLVFYPPPIVTIATTKIAITMNPISPIAKCEM